ncbi:MAG TPA: hypothetical protein VGM06_14005 [Polyangiaceae bacterium]|jgi:hypothetical protein
MTAPPRLVEEGTDLERDLLASARIDVASRHGYERTLAALAAGAATTAAAASSTAGTITAAGGSSVATGGAVAAGTAAMGVSVKWVGVAAFLVAGSAGLTAKWIARPPSPPAALVAASPGWASVVRPPAHDPPSRVEPPGAPTALVEPAVQAPAPESDEVRRPASQSPRIASSELSRVRGATVAPLPPPTPDRGSPAPASPRGSLNRELLALDRVRTLLAAPDASRALQELDVYDALFPESLLAAEARVLRVDALVESGDRAGAASLARRLLAADPASPYAPHLHQVLTALDHSVIDWRAPRNSSSAR